MVHIYGIKSCGSVQKAIKFLEKHSIDYTFHDFKVTPVSREKIDFWLTRTSLEILLNTKGTTYRTLGLKAMDLDNDAKIDWMAQNNLLLKRPIIESTHPLIVGFDESHYEGTLLS